MLTKKTRYALKALIALADQSAEEPMLIADIAKREKIPKKFLEAILRELKQHGMLGAQRGRGGGYFLRRRPEEISLASIIRALDGPIAPVPCLSKTAYRRCAECPNERTCGVRLVLHDLHEVTTQMLEQATLADVVKRAGEARVVPQALIRYSI
jgi:Rrf2 family protein